MNAFRIVVPLLVFGGILAALPSCNSTSQMSGPKRSPLWEKELGAVANTPANPQETPQGIEYQSRPDSEREIRTTDLTKAGTKVYHDSQHPESHR